MGKRSKTLRECVLCGKLAHLTTDHVPPSSMFPQRRGGIPIPVCFACNNGASKDDEYFRAALALRMEVEENPAVKELLPGITRGLIRSRDRGNTGSIVRTFQDADLYSRGGIYVGKGATYEPEDPRLARVAGRIVRGLYYHALGARLPDTHGVAVYVIANVRGDANLVEQLRRFVDFAFTGRVHIVHRDVFSYAVQAVPDQESACVFTMMFYKHTPMVCFTLDRADYRGDRPLM